MVNVNRPLAMSNVAGTSHVYLQKLFNARPTIFEPVMLPSLPVIIEIDIAVALNIILHKKSFDYCEQEKLN